jgi:hypothetical protein
MPGDELILSDEHRSKLDGIVSDMTKNKESDTDISSVVDDFKSKYGKKKSTPESGTSPLILDSSVGESQSNVDSQRFNFATGKNDLPLVETPASATPLITPGNEADLLRAAPSTAETTPKDQTNYSNEAQQTLALGEKESALMRGGANLASSLLKTPAFAYDLGTSTVSKVVKDITLGGIDIKKALGDLGIASSEQISENTGIENTISEDLDRVVEHSRKQAQKKYDKPINEYLFGENPDYEKGFNALANAVIESAPASIALLAGNYAGAGAALSTAAGTAVFGADKKSQLDKENPEMSEEMKLANATITGALEGLTESAFGITKLGSIAKNVFQKSGAEAAKKIATQGFKKTYGKIFTKYLGVQAGEMVGEMANQFGENVVDKYSGAAPDKNLWDGVKDAGLVGFASAMSASAPIAAIDIVKRKSALTEAAELQEKKSALEEDYNNPDVSEAVKPSLLNKIKDINDQEHDLAQDEKEKFDNLTPDQKEEVNALLQESKRLADSAVDETISKDTREIFKKDMEDIDDQIDKVFEMGIAAGEEKAEAIELSTEMEADPILEDQVNQEWLKFFEESIKPVEDIKNKPNENEKVSTDGEVRVVSRENGQLSKQIPNEKNKKVSSEPEKRTFEPSLEGTLETLSSDDKLQGKYNSELIDEEEQIEAKQQDDEASVKKLNDDIEVLKKFDKPDIASKKFSAILERAFKMKEEEKISKPTYTKYRNIAQQVLGPKINVDAEQAKFSIETLKETVKKKLLGEGYKKVLMSAPGFGPKQVADLIDLTAMAAKKAIDLGFTVKEAISKALLHVKNHPHYAKLIEEGHMDEESFTQSVSDTFTKPQKKAKPSTEKESPAKEAEGEVSGIKKSLVSDEIIKGVDLEKISDKEMQGIAKKIIASGEVKPEAIVNEVLKNHRALQPKEVVALIYYKTELDNDLRYAYEEKDDLIKENESTGSVDARIVDLEQRQENFNEVSVITASQQSLAFRLRKGMRDKDFNLVSQIAKYKATNNGEISPEVEAKMRDLDKRYREAMEKVDKLEKEAEENEIEKAHRNIIEDIGREGSVEKNKTYSQKSKELADKVRKLKSKPLTFTTADGKDVDVKLQGISMNGLIELAARTIETTGKIADGINAVITEIKTQDWYKKLSGADQKAINQQVRDYFGKDEEMIAQPTVNEDGSLTIPHSLIREIYKSGIKDINEIVKEVQKQIDIPDVTERQIRDAITRYGKTVNLSKDEVEAGIRQAKRIGKLISQLEDIQEKERPKRSGLQRDKPSDEERRLIKEVKREMKDLPEDPEENARALKSALEATKTRLRNRIADLENQLATGEKTPKSKGVELDAEAKELKEKVEKLRAELESVEGKPKLTDEQRLTRMKSYAKNRIADLENKIKNKDFSKPEKPKPISDDELTKARGHLVELRDEWEKLQYENELRNRTKAQKIGHMMLGILNIPRAFKLGFDLSAIGVQGMRRLSTSPVQSAKAFKDMMSQAFSEKNQKEWLKTLKAQEYYATLKAAGAAFTETDGKISVREENFSNDLVKHAFKFVFNEKAGLNKINPYEASNRAFSGYLNSIRLQGYLEGFKMLERKGKTFESHPQDYKSWAKYINNITGRGSLGKKGNSSELAQFIFTSPRKMISEANLINPWFWLGQTINKNQESDYSLTPTVARKAFGDFALGMGITAAVVALARAAFADDDDKQDKDFTDPRSSNFMGVKIRDEHGGFTVVHPFAAYKTQAVLISRLLSSEMTNTRTGKVSKLGKKGAPKGNELVANFFQNKLSPTLQIGLKRLKDGENYDVKSEAIKTFQPATLEGFLQTYEDYPAETEAALTALAFFGLSQTHIEKKKKR